jgi:16S rRNA (cytosine967-C5)-methyltransferase
MRWLDLCAGPGGKAAYLDSLITDGEFVANEISEERSRLVQQVVRSGKVINHDGRNLPSEYGDFDRILIDAPCTGIGALRRRPEIKWRRTPEDLPGLLELQEELLNAAASRLRPNGVIGFATCSPHQAETKWQIKTFLKRNPKFSRLQVGKNSDSDGDMQLWTFRDKTDAMFLSLLQLKV